MNEDSNIAHICAWCPDKEERDKEALLEGKLLSHKICDECVKKVREETNRILGIK